MESPLPFHRSTSDEPPPFARIAIVGVGLIGGSIAMAVRQRWPSALVIGVDSKAVIERATVAHAIDVGADDLGLVSDAALIVLAAPVRANMNLLRQLPEYVSADAIITDVSSTKRAIADIGRELSSRLRFVPGHPFAGAAVSGLQHARADLFENRPWFLCSSVNEDAVRRVEQFVRAVGARPRLLDATAHDRLMAFLSHLPQLAVSALMEVVGDAVGEEGLALAGRGLQDTTRLASSPAEIWTGICATNADEIAEALDALISTLQELRSGLSADETMTRVFEAAQHWRATMPKA